MTSQIKSTITQITKDRPLFMLCLGILFITLVAIIYFAFRLSVRELQIATRFSEFGETQLYRNKWYYLLNFIGILVVISGAHLLLIGKLVLRDMRAMAVGLAWATILILLIAVLVTYSVFGIAYLT